MCVTVNVWTLSYSGEDSSCLAAPLVQPQREAVISIPIPLTRALALTPLVMNFTLFVGRFCLDYLTIEYREEIY